MNQEVGRVISRHKSAVRDLEDLVLETRKEGEREVVEADLDGYKTQLEGNHMSLRRANTYSRKAIEDRVKRDLFNVKDGCEERVVSVRNRLDKESMTNKASSATEELLSISRMMANQVLMSEQSLNTLVTSSATVTETHEEFKMMGNLMAHSRKLLSKYGRREITDRVFIIFALAFFFASCFYVVMKRLF